MPWGSLFGPLIPIFIYVLINRRDWSECAEASNERTLHVQISEYRAKATECGELVKSSTGAEESRKFQDLENRFVSSADNERGDVNAYNDAVPIADQDRSRDAALQWNALPTTLQREIFDTAGSVGELVETAALRGQIARFLHKHKNETGHVKLPLTEDTPSDARWCAAALSRWDNEGGAVHDGLPT